MIQPFDCDDLPSAADKVVEHTLHRPVAEFVGCRGKRVRGSLLQLAYAMAGGHGDVPPLVVEAIEGLHAGSLVIDDIQDGSEVRRDRPTMHRQIGVPLAINAGNWMYFRSLELLATSTLPSAQRCAMTAAMIGAGRQCHEGQAIDLGARVDQLPPRDWANIAESISVRKTGVLVGLAMELGATAAGAGCELTRSLRTLGCEIGVALQMRNDSSELADDHRRDDLRNARVTWPWAWLADQSDSDTCRRIARQLSNSSDDSIGAVASKMIQAIGTHGDQQIQHRVDRAIQVASEHVFDTNLLDQLRSVLQPIRANEQQHAFSQAIT